MMNLLVFLQKEMTLYNLIKKKGNIDENTVEHYMTKNLIVMQKEDFEKSSVHDMIIIMTKNKIQKLPIVLDGKIYGLVTLKDLLYRFGENV